MSTGAEFLVENSVTLPDDMAEERQKELLNAEYDRARELKRAGTIQRIWRIPGGLRNIGIWSAADATELDALLLSLPLSPWLESEVTPLSKHPVEQDPAH